RLASQLGELTFKPVGALDVVAKYLPYAATQVGAMLVNQAAPLPVVVWGKDGVKQTWANGFISKLPAFTLSATKTPIGSMTITVLGDPTKTLTDAAAWLVSSSAALADITFDETKLLTPNYTATWGAITGFVAVESEDGFTFETAITVQQHNVDNWGVVNAILTDLITTVRFKPVGPTEANIWAAMNLQGASAVKPGMSVTTTSDLVITGGSVVFTLAKA